ncbi:SEL1-like repeat protein [Kaistia granuli]|uniref:SEL1-like repeat protein n=1 Tax=Kaistia granuli TaxID=363259 RepID=UPI000592F55A|nr:SEL1-like repeat protein [Kaistia granuli]
MTDGDDADGRGIQGLQVMKSGSRSGYGAGQSGSDLPLRSPAALARRTEPDGAERLAALSALVDNLTRQIDTIEGSSRRQPAPRVEQPAKPAAPQPDASRAALEGRIDALGRQLDDRQSERLSGIETRLAALANQLAAAKSTPVQPAPVQAAQPAPVRRAPPAAAPSHARGETLASLQAAIAEISHRQQAIDRETSGAPNQFDAVAIEDAIAALRDDIAILGRRINAEARRTDENGQSLKNELAARIQALAETRSPEPDAVELLRRELAEIRQSVELAARETTLASIESGYGHIIERLDDIVRQVPEPDRFDRLAREIAQLATSIEASAPSREVETEIEDIRNAVASLSISRSDAVSAAVERQIASLHAAIDTLAARPAPAIDLSGIEREIDSLRRDMDGFSRGADPLALIRLEKQIAGIRSTIDDIDPRPVGIDSTALSRLEDRIDALAGRFDALAELPTLRAPAAPDAFDGLRLEISQLREDFAAREPVRLDAIEQQMQALVRRLDETTRPDDHQALAQLEAQVGALAEQVSAGADPHALARVEENLDRLQSLLGDSRQDTIEAARDAARATFQEFAGNLPGRPDDHLIQALRDDMRALQTAAERSDRQTHDTLEAVHNTLAKVVHRIAQLEIEERGDAAPAFAAAPTPAETTSSLGTGLPEEHRPLAPGSGRPVPPQIAPAVSAPAPAARPGDRKADFIAAARRAAQAAQSETAEAMAEVEKHGDKPSTFTRIGDALRARKRPLVLAIAAIVLAIGAMQLTDPPGRQASKGAPTNGTTDPVATGSIPAKPAAAPAAPAAKPAPNAMVAPNAEGAGALAFAPPAATDSRFAAIAPEGPPASGFSAPATGATTGMDLETAAAKGDAAAAFEMGRRLAEGSNGKPKDARLAAEWYQRSAEAGLAIAQYRTGSLYERGDGVQRDLAAAQGWYEKASDQGNARATHNLAVLMSEGATGDPDYGKAAQYFIRAANLGVADSQYNLGVLYARGLGVGVDLVQSYKWFALAAQQGDRDAAKRRDEVAKAMKPDALAAARASVQTFKAQPLDTTANSEPRIKPEWKASGAQMTMRDVTRTATPRG